MEKNVENVVKDNNKEAKQEYKQAIEAASLRFMTVEQIDAMILYIINSNQEAFNMYFMLQKAKDTKVQYSDKPDK